MAKETQQEIDENIEFYRTDEGESDNEKILFILLLDAAVQGNAQRVRLLLERGVRPDWLAANKDGLLHKAVVDGTSAEVVRLLLDSGVPVDAQQWMTLVTGLHMAALDGLLHICQVLVEKGADLEARESHNRTALHNAAVHDHWAIVRLLLENGADVSAADRDRRTAFHHAKSHLRTTKVLLEFAHKGGQQAKRELLNTQDRDGNTALHYANYQGQAEVANLLVQEGADPGVRNNKGKTPLEWTD